jgi:hypothetical protein
MTPEIPDFRQIGPVKEPTMTRTSIAVAMMLGGAMASSTILSTSAGAQTYSAAQAPIRGNSGAEPTYADLADLALASELVARAQVRSMSRLKAESGQPSVSPMRSGATARLLIKARTSALLVGSALGESVQFLADVPFDANGKLPKLVKMPVLIMARTVPGKQGTLQLVAPDAMLVWTAERENRLRAILTELNSPGAPPAIAALREALHVRGNLAGEGETQVFLSSRGGDPVSLSILRRPGQPTAWGVSFTDIVDQAARPPERETLAWYRLACFLPRELPKGTNISGSAADRLVAAEDYAMVLADLGPCARGRRAAAP